MNAKVKKLCLVAIGIALYVALSMTVKIPIVGHIALDLGYIVLGVFCYAYGGIAGMIIGAVGCTLISLITSGWFPIGWMLGNAMIGLLCGMFYDKDKPVANCVVTVASVLLGVLVIKTALECVMYGIPFTVKIPKNAVAAIMDAAVMCIGVLLAPRVIRTAKLTDAIR